MGLDTCHLEKKRRVGEASIPLPQSSVTQGEGTPQKACLVFSSRSTVRFDR